MSDMDTTLETEKKTEQGGMPDYQDADHEAEAKAKSAKKSEEHPGGLQTSDPSFDDGAQEVDSHPWNPPEE